MRDNVAVLIAPKVDNYLGALFKSANRSLEHHVHENLRKIQQKLLNTMSPLSKVWQQIYDIRSGKATSSEVNTHMLLGLIEQYATLLDQANVTMNYHRRITFPSKLTIDQMRAKQLIKESRDHFNKTHITLFGKSFHKKLLKVTKARKESKNRAQELGSGSISFKTGHGRHRRHF